MPNFPFKPLATALALGAIYAPSAFAVTLSWQACVEEASRANSELNASRSTLQAAEHATSAAYGNFLPQVTGSAEYSRGGSGVQSNTGSTVVVPTTKNAYSVSLTATQSIFAGLQDRARLEQAQATAAGSTASLAAIRAKVSYDLKSAFASVVFAQNSVRLTDEIVKRREANLRLVQLRYESGRENRGSVFLSRAYLEQAKYERLQAENALHTARAQLARVLGRDETEEFALTGEVPVATPPANVDLKTIATETPAYRQALAEEESSDAGIMGARSQFFPSLNISGTTSRTGPEWYPENSKWSLGVGVTIPLFNGGKDYFGTKAASQTWKAAAAARAHALRNSYVTLQESYAGYREAVQKLEVDRAFRDATVARERIATQKYNTGLLTFDDWDIIQNDLINRQKTYLQSERARVVAEAAWEQAQGKGVVP
jgi:outer membrane protein TolC